MIEFDAKKLTVNQLIAFEEFTDKAREGKASMKDVRSLMALLLRQTPEWIGQNLTAEEMQAIMEDIGRKAPEAVQNAVPLATSGASSPTPTATDTTPQPGS